jgi:membrane protease YdiL (CAAX protease family)
MTSARGRETVEAPRPCISALSLLLGSWTLLASASLLAGWIGRDAAALVSFAAVAILVAGNRPRSARAPIRRGALIAAAAGFASYPAWAALIALVGLALDLPWHPPTPPGAGSPALWIATLALAPVFEELLYRERLLPVLRARIGGPLAVVATSAIFALPHLEPWNVLGTFLVGSMLGTIFLVTESVWPCIALHVGLNVACLACGVPPVRLALAPLGSAALGSLLLATSLRWHRVPPPGHARLTPRPLGTAHG